MAEQECRGWISLFVFFNFPGRIKKPFSAGVSQSEAGRGGRGRWRGWAGNSRCVQGTGLDSGLWSTIVGEVVRSLNGEVTFFGG